MTSSRSALVEIGDQESGPTLSPTDRMPTPDRATSDRRAEVIGIPLLLVAHVGMVALVLSGRLSFFFNDAMHRLGRGTDLAVYYDAGMAYLNGISIYGVGAAFGYRYHPFLAMTAGAAMARGSFDQAYAMFVVICELCFILDLLILRSMIRSPRRFLVVAALFACFTPYYLELFMGNVSFLAASVLLAAWYFDRAWSRVLFIALFCLSVGIKPIGLVLLPLLLVQRRAADTCWIVFGVVLMGLPYFLIHPADAYALWTSNARGQSEGWLVHAGNQGFHGLVGTALTRMSGIATSALASYRQLPVAAQAVLAMVPIAAGIAALFGSIRSRGDSKLGIFLWFSVYLLGFQDVWEHSYSILLVGLGLLWSTERIPRGVLVPCSIALALPTAFAFYDIKLPPGPYDPEPAWTAGVSLLHHATKPLFLLALFVAVVVAVSRRPVAVRFRDVRA